MNPITIVGGGVAGLTLGIGLRRAGVPVTVWEAGRYPRHRVCGEFISGHGQATLRALDLVDAFEAAGVHWARTVAFHAGANDLPARPLPQPALCLSRFQMDHLLAQEFVRAGGEPRMGERWKGDFTVPGVVRASGRRIHPAGGGPRWLGLKAHARGADLAADLEMHVFPEGYVGLCRLAGDRVNVCGLFRRDGPAADVARQWQEWLRGPERSSLRARLGAAEFDPESFCSVAGFSLRPERARETKECRIGDAMSMIPPVTGNGMSMAFESAGLATGPLAAYGRGEGSWEQTRQAIAEACDARFAARLRWAGGLQRVLMRPRACALLAGCIRRFGRVQDWLFRQTR